MYSASPRIQLCVHFRCNSSSCRLSIVPRVDVLECTRPGGTFQTAIAILLGPGFESAFSRVPQNNLPCDNVPNNDAWGIYGITFLFINISFLEFSIFFITI